MKSILPLIVASLITSHAPLLARESVEIRFLAESLPEGVGEVTWVASGKQGEAFTLPTSQLSAAVTVPARVIGLQTHPGKRRLAKIELPGQGDSFVVLLLPEPGGTLKPVPVATDSPSFKAGGLFLYNHAGHAIHGSLGTTEFELAPGKGAALRPAGEMGDGSFDVTFNVREEAGDRVLRTMRWPVQTRSRTYLFFFRNSSRDRIEFRAVDEFVAPDGN